MACCALGSWVRKASLPVHRYDRGADPAPVTGCGMVAGRESALSLALESAEALAAPAPHPSGALAVAALAPHPPWPSAVSAGIEEPAVSASREEVPAVPASRAPDTDSLRLTPRSMGRVVLSAASRGPPKPADGATDAPALASAPRSSSSRLLSALATSSMARITQLVRGCAELPSAAVCVRTPTWLPPTSPSARSSPSTASARTEKGAPSAAGGIATRHARRPSPARFAASAASLRAAHK